MAKPQQYAPALDLTGRAAIVTGGGHGIGRGFVQRLAERGARVVLAETDVVAGQSSAGVWV